MANVNSITSNSYSSSTSLYGNRNVLTGLASGMDTEAMIQNSITGYQTKISQLQQEQTKLEWKQDSYRELIDQMYSIEQKYTSYTSKTNLSSNSFFNNARVTEASGANAAAVSATGTTKSDIQLNAVTQLATATRYSVAATALDVQVADKAEGSAIDWSERKEIGQLSGTMTLKYGSKSLELKFDEKDVDIGSPEKLKEAIEKKLGDLTVTTKTGEVRASSLIKVNIGKNESTGESNNTLSFEVDRSNTLDDGSAIYISSVSGNLSGMLGASKPTSTNIEDRIGNNSFTVGDFSALVKTPSMAERISGKEVQVELDGLSKSVKIGDLSDTQVKVGDETLTLDAAYARLEAEGASDEDKAAVRSAIDSAMNSALQKDLQASIDKQFGKGKVTVGLTAEGGLKFDAASNSSTLKVSSSAAGEALGIGKSGVSNFFNTARTLRELTGGSSLWLSQNARMYVDASTVKPQTVTGEDGTEETKYYSDGALVEKGTGPDGAEAYYRVNEEGKALYSLNINGAEIGGFTEDSTLESVMNKINSSAEAGVNVSYSNLSREFVFTARETGAGSKIEFGDGLAQKLFYAADNAPENVTMERLLGSNVTWDSEGKTNIMIGAENFRIALRGISKDSTVEDLIREIDDKAPGMIQYEDGAYSFKDSNGDPLGEESVSKVALYFSASQGVRLSDLLNGVEGSTTTAGQNAKLVTTVNGKKLELERSSNVVDMDGMKVTLKDTFNVGENGEAVKGEAVSFKTSTDSDTVVDAIKSFVDDVNKLMDGIYKAYTTQPLKKSSGSTKRDGYMPLTEEDKADMSETAVKAYEEKAKTGLLFGDSDLSQLYGKLLNVVQRSGSDRVDMEAIGLKTTYSSGVTQISLDESKLRAALDSDPDKVRNVFTKTTEGGSATNGLMSSIKSTMSAYGSISLGSQGVLVRKAGTKLSSLSLVNNNLQQQINNLTGQIETWQSRLSDKVDYYTKQFTQLEKLMSTMNNQSSMLADLMGY